MVYVLKLLKMVIFNSKPLVDQRAIHFRSFFAEEHPKLELGRQVINVHDVPGRLLAFFFVCDLNGPGRWGKTSVNMSFFSRSYRDNHENHGFIHGS